LRPSYCAFLRRCSGELVTVNLPQSAEQRGWSTYTDLEGVLCIQTDNSDSRGSYYRDPEEDDDMSAQEVAEEIEEEGSPLFSEWIEPPRISTATGYVLNDTTLGDGCISADSDLGCSSRQPMLLRARGVDGSCDGTRWIPYLHTIAPYDCSIGGDLEAQCASALNANAIFSARSMYAPAPSSSVGMKALRYFLKAEGSNDSFVELADATELPAARFDADTGACVDAMTLLQYRFFTDGATGVVEEARVYVELASVSDVEEMLTFGASFEFVGAGAAASTTRDVSGRPGYIRGLPLLVADGNLDSLQLRTDPLRMLQRSAAGACIQSVEQAASAPSSTAALFGEDAAAHCYELFDNASALKAWCTPTSPPELPLLAALNFSWSSASDAAAYVGAYGDSHPEATSDWTPLEVVVPSSGLTREWHEPSQSCRNVLAMMEVQVLFASVGSAEALAKKVLGVQLVLSSQTVYANRCTLGGA